MDRRPDNHADGPVGRLRTWEWAGDQGRRWRWVGKRGDVEEALRREEDEDEDDAGEEEQPS